VEMFPSCMVASVKSLPQYNGEIKTGRSEPGVCLGMLGDVLFIWEPLSTEVSLCGLPAAAHRAIKTKSVKHFQGDRMFHSFLNMNRKMIDLWIGHGQSGKYIANRK
jgi:hypothetical protein